MRTTSDENKRIDDFIVNNYPKKKNDHVKKKNDLLLSLKKCLRIKIKKE
jgi:hypothetical protein